MFVLDANGIKFQLDIKGYKKSDKDNWDCQWCRCDFLFSSGKWLNYHKENDEILLSCEVEELKDSLEKLLDDSLVDVKEINFIEPDFEFILTPKQDLRNNSKYLYIKPGHEIADIFIEIRVYFWDDGLTDNYLSVTLYRDEISKFKDYLSSIICNKGD